MEAIVIAVMEKEIQRMNVQEAAKMAINEKKCITLPEFEHTAKIQPTDGKEVKIMAKDILKPPAVAKILGCAPQAVREHLKRGLWDFGEYIPKGKRGRQTDEYNIPVAKLEAYLGRKLRDDEIA